MLEPLYRCRTNSTLFRFSNKHLRDFIELNHLLIQVNEYLDFARLVAPPEGRHCPDFGGIRLPWRPLPMEMTMLPV